MKTIEIRKIEELNYNICEFILRNRLYNVKIHCDISKVVDSLVIYMTEVGIPWDIDSKQNIISIYSDNNRELYHVYITSNKTKRILSEDNDTAVTFFLRNEEQAKIDVLVVDHESFNLDLVPIHLQNEEIRKMLLRAFIIAESEIDIISPWMNFSVVNDAPAI